MMKDQHNMSAIEGSVPGNTCPNLLDSAAVLSFGFDPKRRNEFSRLAAALTGGSLKKKLFWSAYNALDFDPASSVFRAQTTVYPHTAGSINIPYWQELEAGDESPFLSKKQLESLRIKVARIWTEVVAEAEDWDRLGDPDDGDDCAEPFPAYLLDPEFPAVEAVFDPENLPDRELRQIELAVRKAIECEVRRILKFTFKRSRASLKRNDANRADIHSYRVRTGVSPPEMGPLWTKVSSNPSNGSNFNGELSCPRSPTSGQRTFSRESTGTMYLKTSQSEPPDKSTFCSQLRSSKIVGLLGAVASLNVQTPSH